MSDALLLQTYKEYIEDNFHYPCIYEIVFNKRNKQDLHYKLHQKFWKIRKKKAIFLPKFETMNQLFNICVEPFGMSEIYHFPHRLIESFNPKAIHSLLKRNCFNPSTFIMVFLVYHKWYQNTKPSLNQLLSKCQCMNADIASIVTNYIIGNQIYQYVIQQNLIHKLIQNECDIKQFLRFIHSFQYRKYLSLYIEYACNNDINKYFKIWIEVLLWSQENHQYIYVACINKIKSIMNTNKRSEAIYKSDELIKLLSDDTWKYLRYNRYYDRLFTVSLIRCNLMMHVIKLSIDTEWNKMDCRWEDILNDIDIFYLFIYSRIEKEFGYVVFIKKWFIFPSFRLNVGDRNGYYHTIQDYIFLFKYLIKITQSNLDLLNNLNVEKLENLLIWCLMIIDDNMDLLDNIASFISNLYKVIKLRKHENYAINLLHCRILDDLLYIHKYCDQDTAERKMKRNILERFQKNLKKYCGQLCVYYKMSPSTWLSFPIYR